MLEELSSRPATERGEYGEESLLGITIIQVVVMDERTKS